MKDSKFIVAAFPYPLGSLTLQQWYNYAIVDSYARLEKHFGEDVFLPMGFDSMGLPAENAAKKLGKNPKDVTRTNILSAMREFNRMDTLYERKVITHSEKYQQRTKWLFKKLLEHGLAYKDKKIQHYCPSCLTTLANEQVKELKGLQVCDRCDTEIYGKYIEQWFFKTTDYREWLINDLYKIDYPEKTKKQQLHWLDSDKFTDWCVSRQRKWGCPIPVEGETDTLDTFVDSSFYCLEYDKTRPVDLYIIGNEHACAHLIYARFITKFLYNIGYIDFDEPFKKVIHQGMILKDGVKMSKSKGNVINPLEYDPGHLRMYLMFINHYFEGGSWNDQNFKGIVKFDNRIRRWIEPKENDFNIADASVWSDFNNLKQSVRLNFEAWKTNKVISDWMTFYNRNKNKVLSTMIKKDLKQFYSIINPTILHENSKKETTGNIQT